VRRRAAEDHESRRGGVSHQRRTRAQPRRVHERQADAVCVLPTTFRPSRRSSGPAAWKRSSARS
jgi:hypothetical protein